MLYRIKFISEEVDGFVREIKIDSEASFLDLNKAILESCGYPDDQMTSFYICNEEWERGEQVTREDVVDPGNEDEDLFVMAETSLADFIEDDGQKMEFVFDPFSDRVFSLDVKELIPGEHLKEPVITRSIGEAPQQILDIDFDFSQITAKSQDLLGEDEVGEFYGDGDFNNDEFDLEGFEISDGNDAY